jgi:hypothetical protein
MKHSPKLKTLWASATAGPTRLALAERGIPAGDGCCIERPSTGPETISSRLKIRQEERYGCWRLPMGEGEAVERSAERPCPKPLKMPPPPSLPRELSRPKHELESPRPAYLPMPPSTPRLRMEASSPRCFIRASWPDFCVLIGSASVLKIVPRPQLEASAGIVVAGRTLIQLAVSPDHNGHNQNYHADRGTRQGEEPL